MVGTVPGIIPHKFFRKHSQVSKDLFQVTMQSHIRPGCRLRKKRFYHEAPLTMTAEVQREIVIEFERVQLIRKRAKTYLQLCTGCRCKVDFIPICQAAELFGASTDDLLRFVNVSRCHYLSGVSGTILLCLDTLIAAMKTETSYGPKILRS